MTEYGRKHTDGSRSGGQPLIKTEAMDNLIAQDADLIEICPDCEANKQGHAARLIAMHSLVAKTEAEHEATKQELSDFRQEVSDAVTALLDRFLGDGLSQGVINGHLHQFIVRKPDPLVEVIKAMRDEPTPYVNSEVYANRIHKKLDALGFEIRSKNDD